MKKDMQLDNLTMGTCYYPEHWDESLWESDLRRMLDTGITVIRIAEFAWSKFEPIEGVYTFEFFDGFMELAQKMGMKVIFSTPTATPPAWLTNTYSEVLNADKEGVLFQHGARRHYNYNSPIYQRFTKKIVEKIAKHYGQHPSIIGWQIDNEINCETNEFYSQSDTIAFREFLKEKYETLTNLNDAWGTNFWNQTYTDWNQVYVPRHTISDSTNPHEVLDYTRFVSDSACKFVKLQSDILRKYVNKNAYITTNGLFGKLDSHRMTEESLDFIMYDSYPNFAYCLSEDPSNSDDLNDRKWSRNLTEARSISGNFGIMEQQSGANGWNTKMEAAAPKPGQMTLWTMQSIAHGADYISYFRFRTCTMGTEIYWHGILDYDNRDNRKLAEVKVTYDIMSTIGEVAGSKYVAELGVIKDYDNIWDAELDKWHERVEKASSKGIFKAAQLSNTPMDYVYLLSQTSVTDLSQYKVLIYPHATILTEHTAKLLEDYVAQGGILLMGCRTGYKDETGKCVMTPMPGLVSRLCGTDVTDFTFVGKNDGQISVDWDGQKVEAAIFNDILAPLDNKAQVLGTYDSNYYKGAPGLIRNQWGKGQAYYFGATFSESAARVFLDKFGISNPYGEYINVPKDCEIAVRKKNEKNYKFVLNYAHHPVSIQLRKPLFDLLEKEEKQGAVELQAYQTKVYQF